MKTRFNISSPLNGRNSPARRSTQTPPRCHVRNRRPATTTVPVPDEINISSGVGTSAPPQLEDEISVPELETFENLLITLPEGQSISEKTLSDSLPSYFEIIRDYHSAYDAKKEQHKLTKELVKSTEPILNNSTVAEQNKQKLLNVTALAIEQFMQLKIRVTNIRKRITFLNSALPKYVSTYAKHLGLSEQKCLRLERLALTTLTD